MRGVKSTGSVRSVLACVECGTRHAKWSGQCSACAAWNSIVEETLEVEAPASGGRVLTALAPIGRLDDVDAELGAPRPTSIGELDRVLGGGLVPGSVTLLGGEPGIGKSTLVTQLAAGWRGPALYVSAEESQQQVKARAIRLGTDQSHVWIASETSLRGVINAIEQVKPTLVLIDSIQTIADEVVASAPGSTAQVRECARQLVVEAKRRGVPMLLVGHVTKEGALAGPRVLEHLVDTVLSFDGDRHHALRILRAVKHRFGATDEIGLFEMTGHGLAGVADPSRLFLADRRDDVAGAVIVPALQGQRLLLVEVQALTIPASSVAPARRNTQGVDANRLAMLLAVIERRCNVRVGDQDVYASTVGGVKLSEPAADLGVALAVVSAFTGRALSRHMVFLGEVGLGGEIRHVVHTGRRLAEAARLGSRVALVPRGSPDVEGIRGVQVPTLAAAIAAVDAMRPA